MPTPTVSVIIPTYNQARFLDDAIQSVLHQTYRDYEIVLVDDGSTDNTEAIAKQYPDSIRYIYQENLGLAGARNTGILASQGEYIALLDSDDIWDHTFLASMMALVYSRPDAVVYYCGIRYIDGDKRDLPQKGGLGIASMGKFYQQILRSNFLIPSTILMKRKTIIEEHLFDIFFRRLQDWELWIRLLRKGYRFAGLKDHYLVRYRVHQNNLSVDSLAGEQAARAVIKKHFGSDEGQQESWSSEKRMAYGGLYRFCLLNGVRRQNNWRWGKEFLRQAFLCDPALVEDIDLFYELALGNQPSGYRGTRQHLNLAENIVHIETLLTDLFNMTQESVIQSRRSVILSTAYKAIGLLAYNSEHFSLCRKYFWMAVKQQPRLLGEKWILSCYCKSFLGKNGLTMLRGLRRRSVLGMDEKHV